MFILQKLIEKQDLTSEEMEQVATEMMTGQLSVAKVAGLLVALQSKGPSVDEIAACAKVMKSHGTTIAPNVAKMVDTCGTGGDKSGTFNISTAVSFVVAGCGVPVAKHGNKAVSGKAGSADTLSALGVKIDLLPIQVQECIEKIGIGFMFAPIFHPAMKNVMPIRQELGVRTIFNILGPLTNPANVKHQVVGVFDERLTEILARVLKKMETTHALIVHGNGLDELTTTGSNKITELINGETKTYTLTLEETGLALSTLEDLQGGEAPENAKIIMNILQGEAGPKRDVVLLNSAAALLAVDHVLDFKEGIIKAAESIDQGLALKKLEDLKKMTNSFSVHAPLKKTTKRTI